MMLSLPYSGWYSFSMSGCSTGLHSILTAIIPFPSSILLVGCVDVGAQGDHQPLGARAIVLPMQGNGGQVVAAVGVIPGGDILPAPAHLERELVGLRRADQGPGDRELHHLQIPGLLRAEQ